MSVSKRPLMWFAVSVVVLVWGYFLARPTGLSRSTADVTLSAKIPVSARKEFSLRIPTEPPAAHPVFRVTQGDDVAIVVLSEQPGTLMLHGFTDAVPVSRNVEATVHFKAAHTGRFPLHLHGEGGIHLELAAVEIHPQ